MTHLEDAQLVSGPVPVDLAPIVAGPELVGLTALERREEVPGILAGLLELRSDLPLYIRLLVLEPPLDVRMEQDIHH
jgi:hypothetical protein